MRLPSIGNHRSAVVQVRSGSVCVVLLQWQAVLAHVLSVWVFCGVLLVFLPQPSPFLFFVLFTYFFSPLAKSVLPVPGRVGLMAGLQGFASNGVVHLGAG